MLLGLGFEVARLALPKEVKQVGIVTSSKEVSWLSPECCLSFAMTVDSVDHKPLLPQL